MIKKNFATGSADRVLAKFVEALEEFDCRDDEAAQFDQTVRNLTSVPWPPSDKNHSAPLVATQGAHPVPGVPEVDADCSYRPAWAGLRNAYVGVPGL